MDPGLVMRAQQGDEAAFAAITQSVYGHFLQVSYRILRDRHLAEDATQQALVRIWRKLGVDPVPWTPDSWGDQPQEWECPRATRKITVSARVPG
jgi:DNA-directed RNA polymerase specialized sigma24 family protein